MSEDSKMLRDIRLPHVKDLLYVMDAFHALAQLFQNQQSGLMGDNFQKGGGSFVSYFLHYADIIFYYSNMIK